MRILLLNDTCDPNPGCQATVAALIRPADLEVVSTMRVEDDPIVTGGTARALHG